MGGAQSIALNLTREPEPRAPHPIDRSPVVSRSHWPVLMIDGEVIKG